MPDDPSKTIYDLALHETMAIASDLTAIREPGCWVIENDKGGMIRVPYDPEFKFATREAKRDALHQLEDFEEGYGL